MSANSIDDMVNLATCDQTAQLSDCINTTYPNSCGVSIRLLVGIQALESRKKISPPLWKSWIKGMSDSCDLWEQKSTHFGKVSLTVKELWRETQYMAEVELGPACEVQSSNFIYNWNTVVIPDVSLRIQPHTENCRSKILMFGTWCLHMIKIIKLVSNKAEFNQSLSEPHMPICFFSGFLIHCHHFNCCETASPLIKWNSIISWFRKLLRYWRARCVDRRSVLTGSIRLLWIWKKNPCCHLQHHTSQNLKNKSLCIHLDMQEL